MTIATNSLLGDILLKGDLAGDGGPQIGTNPQLTTIPSVVPGYYSNPSLHVDSKGRITSISDGGSTVVTQVPGANQERRGIVSIGSNLYIDDHDVAATWTVNFGGRLEESTPTGLSDNNCGQYQMSVHYDEHTFEIIYTGAEVQTFGQLVDLINDKTGTAGNVQIVDGNLKFVSNSPSRVSKVYVGENGISCLAFFISIGDLTPGSDNCSLYAKRASFDEFGVVKVGDGLEANDGVLSVKRLEDLPIATYEDMGAVIVGDGLNVDEVGKLGVNIASKDTIGVVKVGDGLNVDDNGLISIDKDTLPVGTKTQTGVVQIGMGLGVTPSGVVYVDETNIPNATKNSIGVVQIGDGIDVTPSGTISTSIATATTRGVVKPGDGLHIDTDGNLTVDIASHTQPGVIQIGAGLNVDSGLVSIDVDTLPAASATNKGFVQVGDGLNVANGVLQVNTASTSKHGVVKVGNGLNVNGQGEISVDTNNFPLASTVERGIASFNPLSFTVTDGHVTIPKIDELPISGDLSTKYGLASFDPDVFEVSLRNDGNGVITLKNYDQIPMFRTDEDVTFSKSINRAIAVVDDWTSQTENALLVGNIEINKWDGNFQSGGLPDGRERQLFSCVNVTPNFELTQEYYNKYDISLNSTTSEYLDYASLSEQTVFLDIPDAGPLTVDVRIWYHDLWNGRIVERITQVPRNSRVVIELMMFKSVYENYSDYVFKNIGVYPN